MLPEIGFIFSVASELKTDPGWQSSRNGREVQCDKCQFHGRWMFGLKDHREEKHRLWECLCCGEALPNFSDFKKHLIKKNCVLHPLGMPYIGCGSNQSNDHLP